MGPWVEARRRIATPPHRTPPQCCTPCPHAASFPPYTHARVCMSQICIRGECVTVKKDGEACKKDVECRSGVCQKQWWPAGAVCATP